MFNPFYPFTPRLLQALAGRGKKYFVRQTIMRAKNNLDLDVTAYFIFSHYDQLVTAQDHYGAISYDPNRFLYHWENEEHQRRLMVAAQNPRGYRIFSSVFKTGWERDINDAMREKIRMYIKKIGWKPARDEGITTHYEIQFGELYLRINYAGREVKVKFEVVENLF